MQDFEGFAQVGPEGLDRALDCLFIRGMEPSRFTVGISTPDFLESYLLRGACEDFPELARWMLEKGAAPTPKQCGECIVALAIGSGRGQRWREELVGRLTQMGGDINAKLRGESALGVMCGRRSHLRCKRQPREKGLLRKLLDEPKLRLEVPTKKGLSPAEEVARKAGHDWIAAQISKARARRERWGASRQAWVVAVLRAHPTTSGH